MKIINLTEHDVNIVDSNGIEIAIFEGTKKTGLMPARLSSITKSVDSIGIIPITETAFGETADLPLETSDTKYIVSRMVLEGNKHRYDLLVPNELVRNKEANIIGCKSLAKN